MNMNSNLPEYLTKGEILAACLGSRVADEDEDNLIGYEIEGESEDIFGSEDEDEEEVPDDGDNGEQVSDGVDSYE